MGKSHSILPHLLCCCGIPCVVLAERFKVNQITFELTIGADILNAIDFQSISQANRLF